MMSFHTKSPARKRPFGPRDGNAMIETSLCFLLFMTIFIGIMEFGWGIFNYNFVAYAAREGTRFAATRGSLSPAPATTTAVETFVRNQAIGMDTSQVAVTTTWDPNNSPGNTVTVNVSYPIPPLLGWLMGNITVNGTSTMRIAQ
jgi:Flp pilus assembly protein TadG